MLLVFIVTYLLILKSMLHVLRKEFLSSICCNLQVHLENGLVFVDLRIIIHIKAYGKQPGFSKKLILVQYTVLTYCIYKHSYISA